MSAFPAAASFVSAPSAAVNKDVLLQVSRERANHVQARHRQDVHQEQREFSLTVGDHSDDLWRRRLRFHLGFHRLGDAEALEYLRD